MKIFPFLKKIFTFLYLPYSIGFYKGHDYINNKQLKETVLKVSKSEFPHPDKNIYTSEKMIQETINLYHQLLNNDS